MIKEIKLNQGKVALVDDDVFAWASKYKWSASASRNTWYVTRKTGKWPLRKNVYLHREIMSAPDNVQVDHISGDGLDCRRSNLRLATHTENVRNRRRQANNASGFKGVSWHKGGRKWQAHIKVDGKQMYLGLFATPEAAAHAYDEAAVKHYGRFARTNF